MDNLTVDEFPTPFGPTYYSGETQVDIRLVTRQDGQIYLGVFLTTVDDDVKSSISVFEKISDLDVLRNAHRLIDAVTYKFVADKGIALRQEIKTRFDAYYKANFIDPYEQDDENTYFCYLENSSYVDNQVVSILGCRKGKLTAKRALRAWATTLGHKMNQDGTVPGTSLRYISAPV